ncbi:2'-5' RNA ligase family protein [Nocardia sp. NPDC056064]|uniref:2'-5' RNA ligase family protein n=1 Tax=Nocardia sp. NPDC056064 TaxID=3345701 RepID=UPI0035DD1AC6
MVQSVELLLDERGEAEIRRQWAVLAEAGIGSPRGATHRPHITVAVAREIWPRIDHALERTDFAPLPVRLGGVLVFGARRPILVRAVVVTEELLALQRRVAELVAPCPGIPPNVAPDAWTPHVTLARRVPPERLGDAVRAVAADHDFSAVVVGIRRWDGDTRQERLVAGGR